VGEKQEEAAQPWANRSEVGEIMFGKVTQTRSLRDWFAGMALQGMLSNPDTTKAVSFNPDQWAACAGELADAMLRAREQ